MSDRRWEITVEKLVGDDGASVNTVAVVWATTAQEAIKQLVDLTTNNGRVIFFSVLETTSD